MKSILTNPNELVGRSVILRPSGCVINAIYGTVTHVWDQRTNRKFRTYEILHLMNGRYNTWLIRVDRRGRVSSGGNRFTDQIEVLPKGYRVLPFDTEF